MRSKEPRARDMRRNHKYIYRLSHDAEGYTYKSGMLHECVSNLRQMGQKNHGTLQWISIHQGSKGNENVNKLAKEVAKIYFIGPNPCWGLQRSHLKGQ